MRLGRKVKNFIATVVVCSSLFTVRPAHAWIWPTIDMSLIGPFISDISTAISEVTGAIAQIENYTKTISSIGDQISAVAKYAAELKNTITNIVNTVNKITTNITRAYKDTSAILEDIEKQINITNEENQQVAEETVEDIEESIDAEESLEDVQEKLNKAKDEQENNRKAAKQILKDASDSIIQMTKDSKETIDMLVKSFTENGNLDEKTKNELEDEADALKEKMDNFSKLALETFDNMQKEIDEKGEAVAEAIKEYSNTIDEYYKGNISREELSNAGKKFKESVNDNSISIDQKAIDNIMKCAEEIVSEVEEFKEKVLDSIANNKDYSDEDEEETKIGTSNTKIKLNTDINTKTKLDSETGIKTKLNSETGTKTKLNNNNKIKTSLKMNTNGTQKYAFHYTYKRTSAFLKGVYAKEDGSFLMPLPLKCKNFDIEKMEKDLAPFRNCVVRAKLELPYFCPNAKDEAALAKCNPFTMEDVYEKNMETDGVYKFVVDEYSRANIVNSTKIKQYATTWQDMENKKATQYVLNDQFNKIDNTRNAYIHQGMIDIENPRLWSQLRRVDAMKRAQVVTGFFEKQKSLYLDGRDDDFTESESKNLGLADISVPDGGSQKKNVISNMILYICDIKWEDVSVAPEDKFNTGKTQEAEANIANCMRKYVEGATKGKDEDIKKQWQLKETKTITDSMFHTLALATINNYKSSKDYAEPNGEEKNIVSLQDGQNEAKTAKEDYSAGAQINYYSTKQLLTIVDADAQNLQTEIMQILPTLNYNQFPDKKE